MKIAARWRAFRSAARRTAGRIWVRLLLVNVVVMLVPLFGLEFARINERQLLSALERDMNNQAALMRAWLEQDLGQGIALGDTRHSAVLHDAAKQTRTRIRVLGGSGELLADSHASDVPEGPEPAPPPLFAPRARSLDYAHPRASWREATSWPALAERREVVAALSGQPASQTRIARKPKAVYLFTATPLHAVGAGSVAGVVYVTRSTSPVLAELYRIRTGLFKLLGAALFLSVGTTLLLALSISRPLTLLSRAAQRITSGERSAPLPTFGTWEIRELSNSLKAMTEELDQRLTYISEFTADVAHEFKSPLTSIRGAAELLATGAHADCDARDRFLENILLDTERLDRLVSRLLVLARIEASAEAMTLVDLRSLVERIVVRARQRGEVELSYAASRTWIRGREADLETAFVNLIDNAQRHSPRDKSVRVAVCDLADGASVSVTDEGPGIPDARREKIWERFYTTDAAHGGTGLGLAIVDSVARAHGGKVELSTSDHGGSCFSISLAAAASKRPLGAPRD